MRKALFVLALMSVPALTAVSAQAQTASDDRFQIEKSGDNYIRLDRKSGAISTCTLAGSTLDCRASADERAALQTEIDRLSAEVEQLKAAGPDTVSGTGISKDGKELTLKLPTEAEIKEVVSFFETMVQRMVDAVKNLAT
jgi:hypothetical protein